MTTTLADARDEFDAQVTYLDTATMGLPPRRAWTELQAALADWRGGTAQARAYDESLGRARAAYARLVGVDTAAVAVGSQVSVLVGLVAASLPEGSEVLTATGDFTSVLFPFLAQSGRSVTVREVPLDAVAGAVSERTALVALSAVQSADGRVADLAAIRQACAATGAKVLLDVTQAVGWLPVAAGDVAYTVCGGYKWLLAPRGTAYLTVRPELMDDLVPVHAGWYAGQDPWASIYGTPLRLAADARRFDVSPAWHAWVGAAPSLELLVDIGAGALHAHAVGLANRFRAGVGLPGGDSAIVSLAVDATTPAALAAAGIAGSMRAGRLRLAFHVCNAESDADRAAEALSAHITAEP